MHDYPNVFGGMTKHLHINSTGINTTTHIDGHCQLKQL